MSHGHRPAMPRATRSLRAALGLGALCGVVVAGSAAAASTGTPSIPTVPISTLPSLPAGVPVVCRACRRVCRVVCRACRRVCRVVCRACRRVCRVVCRACRRVCRVVCRACRRVCRVVSAERAAGVPGGLPSLPAGVPGGLPSLPAGVPGGLPSLPAGVPVACRACRVCRPACRSLVCQASVCRNSTCGYCPTPARGRARNSITSGGTCQARHSDGSTRNPRSRSPSPQKLLIATVGTVCRTGGVAAARGCGAAFTECDKARRNPKTPSPRRRIRRLEVLRPIRCSCGRLSLVDYTAAVVFVVDETMTASAECPAHGMRSDLLCCGGPGRRAACAVARHARLTARASAVAAREILRQLWSSSWPATCR